MGLGLGIGLGTTLGGGFNWSSYWAAHLYNESDLALKFDTRSGNVLTDSVSAETATILIEEFKSDGSIYVSGDKTRAEEKLLDGNDHTIYARIKQHTAIPGTGTQAIIKLGSLGVAAQRGLYVKAKNGLLRLNMDDGITDYEINQGINSNTVVLPLDYIDLVITINGTTDILSFTYYNPSGVALGTGTANQDLSGAVLNGNDNTLPFTFDSIYYIVTNFKSYSGVKTYAQCIDNTHITDLALHYPTIIGLMNSVEDTNHLNTVGTITITETTYIACNSYPLDYGWDEYQQGLIDVDNTMWNRYVCRKANGDQISIDVTVPAAAWNSFRIVGERDGGTLYNLFPSKIRFTNAFFDRSNVTIWGDAARLGYYDAANVKDFHVSELNQRTLYGWLNDGYRGRLYVNFNTNSIENLDRDYCKGIYLYTTDNKGVDNAKVLQYTGDIMAAVLDGGGMRTYDAQNYVKIGMLKSASPMLSFRIDDAYDNAYTDWRPFFNSQGIKPILGVHSHLIGTTVGADTFMTLANLQTLVSEGWLIANHNTEDVDYSDLSFQQSLESLLTEGKTDLEDLGFICDNYIGNKHSSNNAAIEYLTKKIGYNSHLTWNVYGEDGIRGTNPINLNLFRLCAIDTDLSGDYDIDSVAPTTQLAAIDAQLDLCVANNQWAIIFMHDHTTNLENNMQTVINSAISKGVNIVSHDEALANCKYL